MDKDFWQNKKFTLLNDTWQLMRNSWSALLISTEKDNPKPEGGKTFSDLNTNERLDSARTTLNFGRMAATAYVVPHVKGLADMFNPAFEFSTEIKQLNTETVLLLGFLGLPEKLPDLPDVNDPSVDFAIMKALLAVGRMLELLKMEGKKKSDIPAKAGCTKWKNKVSKQEIIEEAYRIEDRDNKSREKICEEIRETFLKIGKKKEEVFSTRYIKDKILKDEWPKLK